jgi:hypothetical protein
VNKVGKETLYVIFCNSDCQSDKCFYSSGLFMSVIDPLYTSEYILLKLTSISLNKPKFKTRFSFWHSLIEKHELSHEHGLTARRF